MTSRIRYFSFFVISCYLLIIIPRTRIKLLHQQTVRTSFNSTRHAFLALFKIGQHRRWSFSLPSHSSCCPLGRNFFDRCDGNALHAASTLLRPSLFVLEERENAMDVNEHQPYLFIRYQCYMIRCSDQDPSPTSRNYSGLLCMSTFR